VTFSKRPFLLSSLLVVAVAWTLGCNPSAESGITAVEAPVEADRPSFVLEGVTVGRAGLGVIVQNHLPLELRDVEIVINEDDGAGAYRFRTELIGLNTTRTYLAKVFRNAAGQSFHPMESKAKKFSLYATTDRGRGFWRGEY